MLVWVIVLLIVALAAVVFWIDRDRKRHGSTGAMGQHNDIDPGQWTGGGS